jgi:hypothetical protein
MSGEWEAEREAPRIDPLRAVLAIATNMGPSQKLKSQK